MSQFLVDVRSTLHQFGGGDEILQFGVALDQTLERIFSVDLCAFRSCRAGTLVGWRREVWVIKRATHVLLTAQTIQELVVNDGAKVGFELSLALLPAEAVRRPVKIFENLCDNVFAVLSAVKSVRPAVAAEDAGRVEQEHFIKPGPVYVLEAIHRRSLSLVAWFHVGRCFYYLYEQPAPVCPRFFHVWGETWVP